MLSTFLAAMMFIAQAAPQPPVAAPAAAQALDPAAMAAARDLLHALGFEEQLESTTLRVAEDTFATMTREFETQYGESIPADLRDRVHRILMENMSRVVAEMRPTALEDSARVYARYFTADEIRELQRLQTNPVMMKVQRVAPQFMSELMQIGVAASARRMPEVSAQLRREIEAWHRDHRRARPRTG